jgi:AraC family transcriptional regulator
LTVRHIPAATYAVFTHRGSLDKLQDTYGMIFTDGLKGYEMADVDEIEWYGKKFKYGQPDSEMDIYIPIKPVSK